jgi:hypothetical protein
MKAAEQPHVPAAANRSRAWRVACGKCSLERREQDQQEKAKDMKSASHAEQDQQEKVNDMKSVSHAEQDNKGKTSMEKVSGTGQRNTRVMTKRPVTGPSPLGVTKQASVVGGGEGATTPCSPSLTLVAWSTLAPEPSSNSMQGACPLRVAIYSGVSPPCTHTCTRGSHEE